MKLTTTADRLKAALDATTAISPGTGKRPQLEATLITVKDPGVAEFAATDTCDAFWFSLDKLDAHEPGVVFLPSANLLAAVKKAADGPITISWDGKAGRANLSFGKTSVQLPVEEVADAPAMHRFSPTGKSVAVPFKTLVSLFERTNFAVLGDFKGRRVLSGVCVKVKEKTIRCVASDGIRMATVEQDIPNPAGLVATTVVTPIQKKLIKPIVNEETDSIDVQPSSDMLCLRGPRGELVRRAIIGGYPDFDIDGRLKFTTKVTIPTKSLLQLLDRALILKETGARSCALHWSSAGVALEMTSSLDGSVGSSLEVPWPYPPITTRIDPTLLVQAVKAADAESVTLSFGKTEEPTVLREEGPGFLFLYALSPKF